MLIITLKLINSYHVNDFICSQRLPTRRAIYIIEKSRSGYRSPRIMDEWYRPQITWQRSSQQGTRKISMSWHKAARIAVTVSSKYFMSPVTLSVNTNPYIINNLAKSNNVLPVKMTLTLWQIQYPVPKKKKRKYYQKVTKKGIIFQFPSKMKFPTRK